MVELMLHHTNPATTYVTIDEKTTSKYMEICSNMQLSKPNSHIYDKECDLYKPYHIYSYSIC